MSDDDKLKKSLTREEFSKLMKYVSSNRTAALAECDATFLLSEKLREHDEHLANLYVKQLEGTRAIYDYIRFRKESN